MDKYLVTLSGNVAVGKSTIGPYLANELNATWLSESANSSMFAHLFASEERASRIISQMAFSTMKVATILSSLLGGASTVVTERSLRDSLIYHELWRDRFSLHDLDEFFDQFYELLDSHPIEYTSVTVWLKCPVDVLMKRISCRREIFEQVHTKELIVDLEKKYSASFERNPPENLLVFDVSELSNTPKSFELFASRVASDIRGLQTRSI